MVWSDKRVSLLWIFDSLTLWCINQKSLPNSWFVVPCLCCSVSVDELLRSWFIQDFDQILRVGFRALQLQVFWTRNLVIVDNTSVSVLLPKYWSIFKDYATLFCFVAHATIFYRQYHFIMELEYFFHFQIIQYKANILLHSQPCVCFDSNHRVQRRHLRQNLCILFC